MSELEEYQQQLRDIEETLANGPQNESLLALKAELLELVSLLQQDEPERKEETPQPIEEPVRSFPYEESESPAPDFAVVMTPGTTVWARTKLTKQYEEARIVTISGNHKTATIKFTDSNTTETYPVAELHKEKPKSVVNKFKKQQQKAAKPKDDKYELELNKGTQSWQNFSKKNKKLKKDKSIFSTSTVVGSKVGVLGASQTTSERSKPKRYMPY